MNVYIHYKTIKIYTEVVSAIFQTVASYGEREKGVGRVIFISKKY